MVLEDSGNGCRAGVAAEAFTVAVPNRHTRKHDFSGARFVADSLADRRIYQAIGPRRMIAMNAVTSGAFRSVFLIARTGASRWWDG